MALELNMYDLVDLERYCLDRPDSDAWVELVQDCKSKLEIDGLFNLPDFMRRDAISEAVAEHEPVLAISAYAH